jgi:proteasome lid subunit RPN8/RPN11
MLAPGWNRRRRARRELSDADRGVVVAKLPRARVELDPLLVPVPIPGRVVNELCSHALEAEPEECCGLVTGHAGERYATVHRCHNEMTARHRSDPESYPRDGTRAFLINEIDYLRAEQEAEGKGEHVTAVYHSHVGAGVYFSELDQEFADASLFPFPDASHIVLAVWDHRVSGAGIFERDPSGGGYVGALIEVAE